ncbi:hypothetical protein Pfo_001952 [Paulownia fortunei]|nr:hypothetical protein Pfo_001952 [Paulownia fortunei]
MLIDSMELVRRCHSCQEHANIKHQPVVLLQTLESPCPFAKWGIDLVGPFSLTSGQRIFLIVATKVINRTILQHIKIRLGVAKGAWVDELHSVLWAYQTTPRTPIGESPFSLMYGTEVVALTEIDETSWRIEHYTPELNDSALRVNLDFINELREKVIARAYNHRVRPRAFQVGDLVIRRAEITHQLRKLDAKWEGPYKVMEVVNTRAYRL